MRTDQVRLSTSVVLVIAMTLSLLATAWAAPPRAAAADHENPCASDATNDDFESARVIEGERGRTPACEGAAEGGGQTRDTWYRWTALTTGFMSFGIGWDDDVWVYRGETEDNLTLVAEQRESFSEYTPEHFRAYADFWAEQGTTYYVRVNARETGDGADVLTWRPGTDYPNPRADFDADGCEDLVVGAPGEDVSGVSNAGAVVVRYGCRDTTQQWHQGNDGTASTSEAGDQFGRAVAGGDFDRDGYADLAIGVPGEDDGSRRDAGTVIILSGSDNGLTTEGARRLLQTAESGPLSFSEAGDRFGWSLASRDLEAVTLIADGTPFSVYPEANGETGVIAPVPPAIVPADLFIGVPGEDHRDKRDAGIVAVFDGTALRSAIRYYNECSHAHECVRARTGGLLGSSVATGGMPVYGWPDRMWIAGQPRASFEGREDAGRVVAGAGIEASDQYPDADATFTPRSGDRAGTSVAMAELRDGFGGYLLVGVPGRDVGGVRDAGMVVSYWRGNLFSVYTQATAGIPGSPAPGDQFGASLATGFFDTDTKDDFVVGVPGEKVSGRDNAGAMTLIYGDGRRTLLHRDSPGVAGDARPDDRFGASVGAIDFDGDTVDEVLGGAPFDNVSGIDNAGTVVLWRRNSTSTLYSATLTPGGAEAGDQFGAAVLQ